MGGLLSGGHCFAKTSVAKFYAKIFLFVLLFPAPGIFFNFQDKGGESAKSVAVSVPEST